MTDLTGLTLSAGQHVTWFAAGRVYLSRPLDIWVAPPFQLWARIGATGPVFRGTRATHSFTAAQDGLLWLASYFPGEWLDASGALTTDPAEYARVSGGMNVCIVTTARTDQEAKSLLGGLGMPFARQEVR